MRDHRDLLPVIIEQENATLPDGYDAWGIKTVTLGNRTYLNYKWPHPGGIATCNPALIDTNNTTPCPSSQGDGLCVATTWRGMASSGIPARLLLLVAYKNSEVLGSWEDKLLRTRTVAVVAQVDGEQLLKTHGHGKNLNGADLRNMILWQASLNNADLTNASLNNADLRNATLNGANLQGATLNGANLQGAYLNGANLQGAYLRGTNLQNTYSDIHTIWPKGRKP